MESFPDYCYNKKKILYMNENEGESMIKAFSAFLLTTIISFVVMVGALLIWVTIQGNHITDPSLADGLGLRLPMG